jgi:hypothetical protein
MSPEGALGLALVVAALIVGSLRSKPAKALFGVFIPTPKNRKKKGCRS